MAKAKRPNFLRDAVAPAGKGDLDTVRERVAANPALVHKAGSHGRTMLWEAAYRGRVNVVEYLAGQGADINLPGCHYTPLAIEISPWCAATLKKRHDVAAFLRTAGAEIGVHTYAYLGDVDALTAALDSEPELLEQGSVQVYWDQHGDGSFTHKHCDWPTPLAFAFAGMQVEAIRLLLSRGAQVNDEMRAIVMLRSSKSPETQRLYEEASGTTTPDPDLKGYGPWPPLVYLCRGDRGGNPEQVKKLLEKGVDIEQRNHKEQTALHVAARAGLTPAMEVLLSHGANPNARDKAGQTPLHAAIRTGINRYERSREAIRLLLAAGADPEAEDNKGISARVAVNRCGRPDKSELKSLLGS